MWHGQAHTGHPIQATGLPCTRYAVRPTGSGGQDEGLQLPHVVLLAQRVLQGLSTKYVGPFLVKVGYVRAMSDEPQLWHRDVPLECTTLGWTTPFLLHAC